MTSGATPIVAALPCVLVTLQSLRLEAYDAVLEAWLYVPLLLVRRSDLKMTAPETMITCFRRQDVARHPQDVGQAVFTAPDGLAV